MHNLDTLYDRTVEALQEVFDPELGVNIWDLGLVYEIIPSQRDPGFHLEITMTLTSAACPLSDIIERDLATALDELYYSFKVNWVWMPAWTPSRISEQGISELRALGFQL